MLRKKGNFMFSVVSKFISFNGDDDDDDSADTSAAQGGVYAD